MRLTKYSTSKAGVEALMRQQSKTSKREQERKEVPKCRLCLNKRENSDDDDHDGYETDNKTVKQ